jgi:hypothetical protein
MYPHRIRLRGPWECEAEGPGDARRITMPCRWRDLGLNAATEYARCRRRFGLPRQLDPHERVWLVFENAAAVQGVDLNGHTFTNGTTTCEFEVTELLRDRNFLTLVVRNPGNDTHLWEEVALEVRCQAFLRNLRVTLRLKGDQETLSVSGEVVGEASSPLELYVLHENRTILYGPVPAGQRFAVESEPFSRGRIGHDAQLRVELVCGAVVWHTLEVLSAG